MSIFDTIKSLFFTKKVDDINEHIQGFSSFMLNRWLSFYDKTQAIFVNETLNKYHSVIDNKEDMFNLYFNFIPKLKYKKIDYVKKVNREKDKQDIIVEHLATSRDISRREVIQYLDILNRRCK